MAQLLITMVRRNLLLAKPINNTIYIMPKLWVITFQRSQPPNGQKLAARVEDYFLVKVENV